MFYPKFLSYIFTPLLISERDFCYRPQQKQFLILFTSSHKEEGGYQEVKVKLSLCFFKLSTTP